jgi:hypothetical protein
LYGRKKAIFISLNKQYISKDEQSNSAHLDITFLFLNVRRNVVREIDRTSQNVGIASGKGKGPFSPLEVLD